MEKVYDYLGNEIKEGMSIYFVQTNLHQMGMGWMIPDKGYVKTVDKSDTDCWILGDEHLVIENNGNLWYETKLERLTFAHPLSNKADIFTGKKPTIAIKGISDKEPTKIKT